MADWMVDWMVAQKEFQSAVMMARLSALKLADLKDKMMVKLKVSRKAVV
jgi:hypothetical protein